MASSSELVRGGVSGVGVVGVYEKDDYCVVLNT